MKFASFASASLLSAFSVDPGLAFAPRSLSSSVLRVPPSSSALLRDASSSSSSSSPSSSSSSLHMAAATLYGHPGTRSPLVNWGAYETGFEFEMAKDLSQNPHPFRQLPCLVVVQDETDNDNNNNEEPKATAPAVVFESGAILQYLHQHNSHPVHSQWTDAEKAAITSWITWANASLDPICFLETPDGKVYETGLKRPQKKIETLDQILETQDYLVNSKFSLADVAVASYLLYVLQFFPGIDLASNWPNMTRYLHRCASRDAYRQAFGEKVQNALLQQLSTTTTITTTKEDGDKNNNKKKLFGMF